MISLIKIKQISNKQCVVAISSQNSSFTIISTQKTQRKIKVKKLKNTYFKNLKSTPETFPYYATKISEKQNYMSVKRKISEKIVEIKNRKGSGKPRALNIMNNGISVFK